MLVVAFLATETDTTDAPRTARFERCLVSAIDEVEVPAQEPGLLSELTARPGQQVKRSDILGRINDTSASLRKQAAEAERDIAVEKASNDVNARYARAVRKVAETEYRLNADANAKVPGTKSLVEMQKLQLSIDQATLQIEQAEHDQKLAGLEAAANQIKVRLADDEIQRRQIRAPLAGEVVEVLYRAGEWVQMGDTVVRIVRLDRLRVEAFIKADRYSRSDVQGRPVQIRVAIGPNQQVTFAGQVTFVDPRIQAGGVYQVWAEVDNRQTDGQWELRPGLDAEMTIELAAPKQ
ncbi:MAG: HlyD family efflux transporter periplasmic adaptor subunit [Planctomycetes bacterium]|nr:HlyD family efflux transporter periplasmic adaptor subunit [Planctomycetota bacterium]